MGIDTVSGQNVGRAYAQMLRVVKNVTSGKRITNEVLYTGLPRISTTIRERRNRFRGHCWRSKNEVVSDLVLWEPKHGERSIGGQAGAFVDLLEADTAVPRDCLPAAMDDSWLEKESHGGEEGVGCGLGGGGGGGRSTEVDVVVTAAAVAVVVVV